jgi:hypothetical protein
MASGFTVAGGTDLDSVLAGYVGGTKASNTGFVTGGSDIANRYAPLPQGTAASATGYHVAGGGDLNTVFAKIGTLAFSGTVTPTVSGSGANITYSFISGSTGSISPTTFKGFLVFEIVSAYTLSTVTSTIIITNNINSASWFTTAVVNGQSKTSASASYNFVSSNGNSIWTWTSSPGFLSSTSTVAVSIT